MKFKLLKAVAVLSIVGKKGTKNKLKEESNIVAIKPKLLCIDISYEMEPQNL